ncbi:aliphatic sulfonate ABC transporter substrate-binding protein [Pseudomonas sp. MWU16-30317]|uniref:aliphatic sulfonate ABC transporter substrate-binding protein n=1 Tax=Pseudomonas sp. MWU16-30317 TaxID=2878095 RepID=UPI001CFA7B48|nr:aliphatic sulfonate ABC transporter substrate-binding protein [Pseudomonas sp. MWU16-30317]
MRLPFKLLSTVAAIAVASTFTLSTSADTLYPQTVHIGYQKGNSLVVLKNSGTLEQALASHGVKVVWQEFAYGPPLVEAINSGDIDIGFVGATPPVFAQAGAGPDVTYVGYSAPYQDNYAILVPKDSTAHSLADLKGKRIAVAKGSAGQYLLIAALEQAKLQLSDVDEAYLGYSEGRAAFERGDVAAWVVPDPRLADTELSSGARPLITARSLPVQYSFYIAPRAYAQRYPQTLAMVLKELDNTERYAGAHQAEVAKLLSDDTKVPVAVWTRTLARQPWGVHFPLTPQVIADQQRVADTFLRNKLIPKEVHVADAVIDVGAAQ